MELLTKAAKFISEGRFSELEDLWTEMILAHDTELSCFFKICDILKKEGLSEKAPPLLEMLAEHHESAQEFTKSLAIYKKMIYFSEQDLNLRKRIIDIYKKIFINSEHLGEYLDISGLNNNTPILKALAKLEKFLEYDVGKCFYFERYGFGKVIDTIPQKKEIVIDFEKKKKHFLLISVAEGLLTPVTEGSFLYYKYTDLQTLKKMSAESPDELLKMIIKDSSEPLNATQIKTYLEGILGKKQLGKWWEKQRKNIEKDERIKVSGRTTRYYSYIRSDQDKATLELDTFRKANPLEQYLLAESYTKKEPELFKKITPLIIGLANKIYKKEPGLALDILMLCKEKGIKANFEFTAEMLISDHGLEKILNTLQNTAHQRSILTAVKKQESEWVKIFKNLMLATSDPKLLQELTENLGSVPDTLKDVYFTIISFPKKYPAQYQWLLKSILAGKLKEYSGPSFVPKMIDSIDHVKGIKGTVMKILDLANYDKIIGQASQDEAKRILEAVEASTALLDYKKKDFKRIIEYHHPALFSRIDDIIYATAKALRCKQDELDHIVNIAIPENKKEISRAREFGDLSENFEYKAAREQQEQLYSKVRTIEEELSKVQIITRDKIMVDRVSVGSEVNLQNLSDGTLIKYTILGRWDTDLEKDIISNEAPVARILLKKKPGDRVIINETEYEIVKIEEYKDL